MSLNLQYLCLFGLGLLAHVILLNLIINMGLVEKKKKRRLINTAELVKSRCNPFTMLEESEPEIAISPSRNANA